LEGRQKAALAEKSGENNEKISCFAKKINVMNKKFQKMTIDETDVVEMTGCSGENLCKFTS